MAEIISYTDIQNKYDSQWVLLEDPEIDEFSKIKSAKLLWFSKNRDEIYQKANSLKPKHAAILFIGKPSGNITFVL